MKYISISVYLRTILQHSMKSTFLVEDAWYNTRPSCSQRRNLPEPV